MKVSVPPGYVRKKPVAKPKLDPFIPMIDRILGDDKSRPKKQQHTAKRIFERLRDEYGFTGGITIVKDYVAGWRQRAQEMFVPLVHPPGHAQADFGEAIGVIGGVERKIHFFAFDLPHSDACFVVGYPAETTEAFCDGHVRAFAFFGGVPKSIPTITAAPITSAERGTSRHTGISHPRDDRQRLRSRRRYDPFPGGAARCLEHFPLCRKVPRFPRPCCRAFSPLVGIWPLRHYVPKRSIRLLRVRFEFCRQNG